MRIYSFVLFLTIATTYRRCFRCDWVFTAIALSIVIIDEFRVFFLLYLSRLFLTTSAVRSSLGLLLRLFVIRRTLEASPKT